MSRFTKAGWAALGLFLAVLLLETRGIFSAVDPVVTRALQSANAPELDLTLSFFSLLGSFELTLALVLAIALWVFRAKRRVFSSLILFGMILVFEFVGKLFLYHPGPPPEFFRFALPFALPTAFVQTNYSFPSGHVSRTIFLAVVAWGVSWKLLSKRRATVVTLVAVLVAAVMIYSRIYLGEHWASDTLGGLLLGSAMGFFTLSYWRS